MTLHLEKPYYTAEGEKHFFGKHAVDFEIGEGSPERWREYVAYLRKIVNNHENYIDEGGVGEVYGIGSHGICIKLMPERRQGELLDAYNLGNTAASESWFLEELSDFEVEGVRSPALVEYLEGPKYTAIIMERLDAVNLQHVLNGTAQFPEKFDVDNFFSVLESYLYELHDQKNICHGDLEPRNIMIDVKTGLPRVIDFGRSIYLGKMQAAERQRYEKKEIEFLDAARQKTETHLNKDLNEQYA